MSTTKKPDGCGPIQWKVRGVKRGDILQLLVFYIMSSYS